MTPKKKPRLMAVLNVTPDSFYSPSRYPDHASAIQRGHEIIVEGADIVDVGGESTRPGSTPIQESEELDRVLPVVSELAPLTTVSIDTHHARVAKACLAAGARWINDISGFTDPAMRELAASTGASLCVMHMQGTPQTMQQHPQYPDGVVDTLLRWFEQQIHQLTQAGVKEEQIYLDPGIGFGKTVAHNVEILQNLPRFRTLGYPLLLGASRKSFASKILGKSPEDLLSATLAVHAWALRDGVQIIRVHDVAEHRSIIDLLDVMESGGCSRICR